MASMISDKDIENLERIKQILSEVKQILKEIREIDENFSLNNIIEADEDTILIFNCSAMLKKQYLINMQEDLEKEFGYKCIILNDCIKLDKAIRADYAKGKDYVTETYYDGEGNVITEKNNTVQIAPP